MGKFVFAVFVKGVLCLMLSIIWFFSGAPDETDVAVQTGHAVTEQLAQTSDSPQVKEIANNTNAALDMIAMAVFFIGLAEIIGSGIALAKSV